MPGEIDFGALRTPDIIGNALKYRQAGREQGGMDRGGAALGAGDYAGAAREFGNAGLTDEARQALSEQRAGADKDQAERAKVLIQAAQGLKHVPMGQRRQALQGAYPMFQAAKVDTSIFDPLTEDQLTDQALDTFAGNVASHVEGVNLGNGGYGTFNKDTGEFKTLREPVRKPIIVGNGAVALGEDGEPIYRNPKTFAPPRPRAAPAGGAAPSGPIPPWARKW